MRDAPPSTLTTPELQRLLAAGARLWLVCAPDRAGFEEGHIPGSLSLPGDGVLAALALRSLVVVYGEDARATAAPELARRLARVRAEAVRWYAGGLSAWRAAGLPVDGTARL